MSLNREIGHLTDRPLMIVGAAVSWSLIAALWWFGTPKELIFASVLIGPTVLLITYFAVGGQMPAKLRKRGWSRLMLVPLVFWPSCLAAIIAESILR